MILVMKESAQEGEIVAVRGLLEERGYAVHISRGQTQTVLGVIGDARALNPAEFEVLPGVARAVRVSTPYKLAGVSMHPDPTIVDVGEVRIGGNALVVIAGPCAVESREQITQIASIVKRNGIRILRGGGFKPRTSPYSFQGLGVEGVRLLREAADAHGMKIISEVMDTADIPFMSEHVDILQVGARNMQNFSLLKALGKCGRPVLLKRGMAATIEEWLMAAEYVLAGGNGGVILCERGIRTFEPSTRNTLDISAIPVLKDLSHLPVVADPSHASGRRDKVIPLARAAVAAGADGVMIEVHHSPADALSDGPQSLYPDQLAELLRELRIIAPALGRTV